MFLCRLSGVRLSLLAPLDQALKSSGLLPFRAHRPPGNITWTLPNKYTLRDCRSLFTSAANLGSSSVVRCNDREKPCVTVKHRDSSSSSGFAFITTDFQHWSRTATIASQLPESLQKVTYGARIGEQTPIWANRCPGVTAEAVGRALFWSGLTPCSRRGVTVAMQTRASSTAAAAHKPQKETGETDNKGEEQRSKEPLTPPSSSPSSGPEVPEVPEVPGEPGQDRPSKAQQLKKVFKEYGAVGVSFHVCISLMSLGIFYLLVSSGLDMPAMLCKVGFSEAVVQSKMAAGTSTFVLAYAVHKLFAPMRISITLVCVPLIVRYFRRTGLFKPPAP